MTWEGTSCGTLSVCSAALCSGYVASRRSKASAHAQETYLRSPVPAPSNAFELQLSGGYTQGFGNIFPSHSIGDVAGAGVGFTVAVGYRYTPAHLLRFRRPVPGVLVRELRNVPGHRHERRRDAPRGTAAPRRSLAAPRHRIPVGLAEQLHPRTVRARAGRLERQLLPAGTSSTRESDTTSAPSSGLAWAPVVGANLQTFIWANSTALAPIQWGTFIYAGLQARFDAGGTRSNVASTPHSGFAVE